VVQSDHPGPAVPEVPQENAGSLENLAQQEKQAILVRVDHEGPAALTDSLDLTERWARQDHSGRQVNQDLRVPQGLVEFRVLLDPLDHQVHPASADCRVNRDLLDPRDLSDLLALPEVEDLQGL